MPAPVCLVFFGFPPDAAGAAARTVQLTPTEVCAIAQRTFNQEEVQLVVKEVRLGDFPCSGTLKGVCLCSGPLRFVASVSRSLRRARALPSGGPTGNWHAHCHQHRTETILTIAGRECTCNGMGGRN